MTFPDVLFVSLRDARPVGGRLEAVHELRCAELRASLHACGVRADQLVEPAVTTLASLGAAVRRRGARIVVVAEDAVPGIAAALVHDLRAEPGLAVALLSEVEAAELATQAGAAAGPGLDLSPSPWLLGLLPARSAARVGVRGDDDPECLRAELEWIERRSPLAQVVPIREPTAWEDVPGARERVAAIERAALSYVRIAPRLDPHTAEPEIAAALAAAGAAEIVLTLDAADGPPALARAGELARAGAATNVHVELRPSGAANRDEAWIAALARSGIPFDVAGEPNVVVPELQRARSFRARAAAAAQPPQRLRRALEGDAPACVVDHARDLLWSHEDDPRRHADWLRDVLGADSSLAVLRPGPRPLPVVAPVPLRDALTIGVEPGGRDGASTWHVAGEIWHVRPYADAPGAAPMRPLVLTLERRADLDALVADADEAHATGRPPLLVLHPLVMIAGLMALSTSDPGPTLAHLFVDHDGAVRSAPAGRLLGRVGDAFDVLRARTFARRDEIEARAGSVAAVSLPAAIDENEAAALLAERPYLRVLAHLPRVLRALATTGGVPRDVRVAGLGGPLLYDGPADPRRPLRRLVLRIGDRYAICDRRGVRSLRVGRDLAAICEGLDATGDVATVAGWLAAARRLTPEAAARAVSSAVGRLRAVGMLEPAEPMALPADATMGRVERMAAAR